MKFKKKNWIISRLELTGEVDSRIATEHPEAVHEHRVLSYGVVTTIPNNFKLKQFKNSISSKSSIKYTDFEMKLRTVRGQHCSVFTYEWIIRSDV